MRKPLIAIVVLVVLAAAGGGFYWVTTGPLSKVPLGVLINPDTRKVAELSERFLEDIRFKDFKAAAQYSSPEDREKADIPRLIERLFQIKPELLDINTIEVLAADLDSTKKRAKVRLRADVQLLNSKEHRKPELLLYWKKTPAGAWQMDLASSLQ